MIYIIIQHIYYTGLTVYYMVLTVYRMHLTVTVKTHLDFSRPGLKPLTF